MEHAPEVPPQTGSATPLLGPTDPAPYQEIAGTYASRVLLVCDHASNVIPVALGNLGLSEADRHRHIAYDIGGAAVTRYLAASLGAPALLSGFSRLVIDCNRDLSDDTLIPDESDGTPVPGNENLTAAARAARLESCFWPYHRAIERRLDHFLGKGVAPAIVAIHSFTPSMAGFQRPWHVGILWDDDPRLPLPLLEHLGQVAGIVVGDNEPYSARDPHGFTMQHHAIARGLPHVLLELRQDEIATDEGARRYARLLHEALEPILADDGLYESRSFR
jgi:predicted N-formylglutamate amidohydrolase